MTDWDSQLKKSIYSLTGVYPHLDEVDSFGTSTFEDLVEALEEGANPDIIVDKEWGQTSVFYCTVFGPIEALEELLKHGANANVPAKSGTTPLHFIVEKFGNTISDSEKTLQVLLKYGANPDIEDGDGFTAFGIAKRNNDPILEDIMHKSKERLDLLRQEKQLLQDMDKQKKRASFRKHVNKNNKPK